MLARLVKWIIMLMLLTGCTQPSMSTPSSVLTVPSIVGPTEAAHPTWSSQPIKIAQSFHCPVTLPNGSQPPGEKVLSPQHHGNGALWTVLPADGILTVRRENDGRLSIKLPWWRGVTGTLTIEGHRLDEAPEGGGKFSAHVPDGYGDSGFQASGVYFSSEGCWELTGRIGSAELKFVVDVITDE